MCCPAVILCVRSKVLQYIYMYIYIYIYIQGVICEKKLSGDAFEKFYEMYFYKMFLIKRKLYLT